MQNKRTALVTGGAGFIGSHLCNYLLEKGNKVICVDNLGSGNTENISTMLKNPDFTFIKHDISKVLKIDAKIDEIYHLGSRASPIDYKQHPIETAMANSFGTYNLLNLAMEKNAKILFASTSEVYGDPEQHPQREEYWGNVNPIGERSCYDESKRFGESLMFSFKKEHNVDIKIVRIFNTYGPQMRLDDGRVIPNFITQALKNEPITVHGDGSHTRSLCYVSDLVEGIYLMMNSNETGPINLGNPTEISILDTAKKIKKLTNSTSKIIFVESAQDDPVRRKPDISKAKKVLKWEPKIGLDEGLQKTINWFRTKLTSNPKK